MDRHIGRTIVRNSAGDARVIWSIFSGYHPQGLRESGAPILVLAMNASEKDVIFNAKYHLWGCLHLASFKSTSI